MNVLPSQYPKKGLLNEEKFNTYKDLIFDNKLLGDAKPNSFAYGFKIDNILDDKTTYYGHNEFGYRSGSWDGSHEILAIGCSNTYGRGIPEKGRWTNILEEISNKKVANLSAPGQAINFLVSQAFAYFKKFGNPESVICFFPDPYRINLPISKNFINSKNNYRDHFFSSVQISSVETADEKSKYLKKPYYYEDILPIEVPIFFSMKAIHSLEQYCNSNKINLIWSSWHDFFIKDISGLDINIFDNFIINEELYIKESKFSAECHSEYKERFEYYFSEGRDQVIPTNTHPGVHKNIHFAEIFYKEMNKKW